MMMIVGSVTKNWPNRPRKKICVSLRARGRATAGLYHRQGGGESYLLPSWGTFTPLIVSTSPNAWGRTYPTQMIVMATNRMVAAYRQLTGTPAGIAFQITQHRNAQMMIGTAMLISSPTRL